MIGGILALFGGFFGIVSRLDFYSFFGWGRSNKLNEKFCSYLWRATKLADLYNIQDLRTYGAHIFIF